MERGLIDLSGFVGVRSIMRLVNHHNIAAAKVLRAHPTALSYFPLVVVHTTVAELGAQARRVKRVRRFR